MLGASRSNLAWPNTISPSTVSLTAAARLHRSPVEVAVPVHSPSYGPAASALLNCGRSSKNAAAATMSGPFIPKLSLLYVFHTRTNRENSCAVSSACPLGALLASGSSLHGHKTGASPPTRSEDQRTGGARDGAGFPPGTPAGDGGGAEVLSRAPCWVVCSLVTSAASLSTLCRTTARPRDIAAS